MDILQNKVKKAKDQRNERLRNRYESLRKAGYSSLESQILSHSSAKVLASALNSKVGKK